MACMNMLYARAKLLQCLVERIVGERFNILLQVMEPWPMLLVDIFDRCIER